jgi:BirA family transcriptional regulator, biotin operon repressor / biotin---[acetyl-CoA-carboxylase] ligase
MSDPIPADLAAALDATRGRRGAIGEPIYYFSEASSTNDLAARLAEAGAATGAAVIAGRQTAGRGRLGRRWFSPPDAGLYLSVILRGGEAAPFVTLAGGVAVAEGVRAATGLPVEIKWPNDVVMAGTPGSRRKLAGILAEATSDATGVQYVVLGIGINLRAAAYPPDIADRATSLETELGRTVDSGLVLGEILASLAAQWDALTHGGGASVLARWRRLSPLAAGSRVEWDSGTGRVSGVTAGLADDGALLVRTGGHTERIISGELLWK